MAKKTTSAKKETTNNAHINEVTLEGIIYKVLYTSEKVANYVLENHTVSPKGNTIKTWVNIKEFKPELHFEKGERVTITGEIGTDSYEKDGKKIYNTVIIGTIKGGEVDDEIPFN